MSASHLTSEEREIFASYGRELAEKLGKKPPAPTHKVVRATIAEVGDYTYDVKLADGAVLPSIPRTIGSGGASVGDTCLLEWLEGRAFVTSVLANSDNDHYVNKWVLYRQSDQTNRYIGLTVCGQCAVLEVDLMMQLSSSSSYVYLAKLPDGLLPDASIEDRGIYGDVSIASGGNITPCRVFINGTTGDIGFFKGNHTGQQIVGSMAFLVRRSGSS